MYPITKKWYFLQEQLWERKDSENINLFLTRWNQAFGSTIYQSIKCYGSYCRDFMTMLLPPKPSSTQDSSPPNFISIGPEAWLFFWWWIRICQADVVLSLWEGLTGCVGSRSPCVMGSRVPAERTAHVLCSVRVKSAPVACLAAEHISMT